MEQTLIAKELVAMMIEKRQHHARLDPMRDLLIWAEREWGGMTLEDIGQKHHITRERVRQIHTSVNWFVKNFMKDITKEVEAV